MINQNDKNIKREPIILSDINLHIPWGPTGYYQNERDLFYKKITVDGAPALRDEKDIFGKVTLSGLSIGKYQNWKCHFDASGDKRIVPPLPLLVAITEKLYKQKHPALDELVRDFRGEGLSTATTIRYAGSHVMHDFGSEQVRVHCYVPPTSIFDGQIVYEQVKEREAWRKVFQALLLTADLDKSMGTLQEIYGGVSLNVCSDREDERAYTVPIRIHSRAFGKGFEINAVPSLYSTSDLHRVRGVQLERLCLVQEVA